MEEALTVVERQADGMVPSPPQVLCHCYVSVPEGNGHIMGIYRDILIHVYIYKSYMMGIYHGNV